MAPACLSNSGTDQKSSSRTSPLAIWAHVASGGVLLPRKACGRPLRTVILGCNRKFCSSTASSLELPCVDAKRSVKYTRREAA